MQKQLSKLTLLSALLLSSLFIQYGCKNSNLDKEETKKEQASSTVTPITDTMIARARQGNGNTFLDGEFLANKLKALKNEVPGVNINEKSINAYEFTALHYAAILGGDIDITQALLTKGADVNAKTKVTRQTPIYWAAQNGHAGIVQALLSAKANPNAIDIYGDTPLHVAAEKGYIEIVKALLANGANKDIKNISESTPFKLAKDKKVIGLLSKL